MSKSIVINVPHALGKDEAQRRVAREIDQLKSAYVDKFAHSEVNWSASVAQIRVIALAQEVTAQIDVAEDTVRVEVHLPWLLASLANSIHGKLMSTAKDTLALPPTKKA
jgi:hypothetical protein